MSEAEYWKERSRLLEEYVQHIPGASPFNDEGRAAYKEWKQFVNNEGIPMPPRAMGNTVGGELIAAGDAMYARLNKPREIHLPHGGAAYDDGAMHLDNVAQEAWDRAKSLPSPDQRAGVTVEAIMEVVCEAYGDMTHRRAGGVNLEELRNRLTALIHNKE